MQKLVIYAIFLFAFFGNSLVEKGFITPYASIVTEAFIYLLFLYSLLTARLKGERYVCPLWFSFGFLIVATLYSAIINDYIIFKPVFSLRLILRFYFFYLALINMGLDDTMLKKINKLLFILFIIQLPVVAYKFSYRGISEDTIGTYATHGGGLTPIIPIVALGYLAGYYFYYQRRFSYIFYAIGFILLGIAGEKRALLFIYPIAFMGIYFLACVVGNKENIIKQFGLIICIAVFSIIVSGIILKYHKGYNYYQQPGESIDIGEALKFAKEYTTRRDGDKAYGRVAMIQLAFEIAYKNGNMFLGFGPGSLTGSILSIGRGGDSRLLPIYESYGRTGFVQIFIEYGLLGVLGVLLIFYVFTNRCWKWFKYEKDPYWRAFAMGSLVFTIYCTFIFFCYNPAPLLGDTITPVYYYAMATMHIKLNEILEKEENKVLNSG